MNNQCDPTKDLTYAREICVHDEQVYCLEEKAPIDKGE